MACFLQRRGDWNLHLQVRLKKEERKEKAFSPPSFLEQVNPQLGWGVRLERKASESKADQKLRRAQKASFRIIALSFDL